MPSVHRRTGYKFWIGAFSLPDGTRCQRSTKSTDKSVAIQIVIGWERAARLRATNEQAQRVMADIVKAVSGDVYEQHNAHDCLTAWLTRKKRELDPGSYSGYKTVIDGFKKTIPSHLPLAYVTKPMVVAYRDHVASSLSVASANKALKHLKTFFTDARSEGFAPENITMGLKPLSRRGEKNVDRRPFELHEFRALFSATSDDIEWQGMELFGIYTGQRLSDIAKAHNRQLKNGIWKFKSGKTGRNMQIPLSPYLLQFIEKHLPKTGPLFPKSYATSRSGTLSNRFYEFMFRAGLVPKRSHHTKKSGRSAKRQLNELSFHSLRHTLTTALKEYGTSESVAMEFVGHESAAVNRQYTHMPLSTLIEASNRLPDFLKKP